MSNDKRNEFHGELLPPEVARKAIYELGKVDRVPPAVGIFDSPTRCFVVNVEWWSHIAGMVHLLADVVSWKDADDESYFAITEILRFMQGIECMDFQLRQNPADDCLLEQTTDGGETWTTAFNFALCLNAQLSTISTQLTTIEIQNMVDNGFSVTETTILDNYTPEELVDLGVEADICDTDGKDAVYGAIDQLVRYIHGLNVDFLQELSQAANVPEQASRFVSAVPGVGLLPFDELISYTAFIVNELLAEYNATADETLLQNVICDLFCIAVASDCVINLWDVYNYFSSKVSPSLGLGVSTVANLTQFAITGTFSGDDYFYYLCYFQMAMVALKSRFLAVNSASIYAQQLAAGFNSPDNDWSIFCIDCPQMYRIKTYDFAMGLNGATLTQGVVGSGSLDGVDVGTAYAVELTLPHDPAWRIEAIGWREFRAGGTAHGGLDDSRMWIRPTPGSNTGAQFFGGGFMPNGELSRCWQHGSLPYMTGINELYFRGTVRDVDPSGGSEEYKLYEIVVMYDVAYAPVDAVITLQTPSEFVTDCL